MYAALGGSGQMKGFYDELNVLSSKGWEFVSESQRPELTLYLFRRPVQ